MPRVATVAGVKIYIYFLDHAPPHFHAIKGDDEAIIAIGGDVIAGSLPRTELNRVLAWAGTHVAELDVEWNNAQAGRPLGKI